MQRNRCIFSDVMEHNGIIISKDNILIQYPSERRETAFTIPNNVTSINSWAFYNCSHLTSITIPASVTEICCNAFRDCHNLTSITLPESVTHIDFNAFAGCCNLGLLFVDNVCENETKNDLENYFAEHDGKSINSGSWDGGAHLRVHVEKFTDLDDLPYKSLLCIEKKHWVVYLGMKGEDAVVLDSNICDGFMKLPIDELKECAIIKPKSVKTDDKAIHNIMMDFELNEKKTLEDLRRREFSKKFARLIERLEEINISEKDYNTYIKRSQNFLDKLKKDHHRYEYRTSETID